jgi:hypothetical protein
MMMNKPMMILTFALTAYTTALRPAAVPEIQQLDNPWGVLLIPGEPTALHSATWRLCLIVDAAPLQRQMKALEEQWAMDLTFQKRVVTHPTGVDLVPALRDALDQAREKYKRLQFRMHAQEINSKAKRAAPVVGETGNFLSYLFGIAATDDTDRLQLEINAIVNRQKSLVNVQAKQLTTFHVIENSLAAQQKEIDSQVNATKLLFHAVVRLYLDRFGPNTTQLGEHVHWQHQFMRSVRLFCDTVQSFHHAIDRAEDGFLAPSFLPRQQLEIALQHIADELPQEIGLPVSPENLPAYYETRLCTYLPTNNTLFAIMNLPLVNKSDLYIPYQIQPFPSTTSPPVKLVTDKLRVYAHRKADRFVTYSAQDTFPTCLFAKPPVCDVNGRFIETAPNDCVTSILAYDRKKGNGKFPHGWCHFASIDEHSSTALKMTPTRWAVYAQNPTTINFKCPNRTIPAIVLENNHLVALPPNCSADFGTIHLPLTLQGHLTMTTVADVTPIPIRPPPFHPKPDVFGKQLLDAFARQLHDADHGQAQEALHKILGHLKNATQELGKEDVVMVNERLWASHGVDLGVALIILGTACLILCRCCCPSPCCFRTQESWCVNSPSAPVIELIPRPFGRESDLRENE